MSKASLKASLEQGKFIAAPGIYDGLSARIADGHGFGALYLSGYAVSASLLGKPDAGFLTATHMADRVRALAAVTKTPIIADADTGFGGVVNVVEAVEAYEQGGAAAIQIEDQVFPKRCGHTKNRQVIETSEAALKIKAAAQAKNSDDFLIIARTDACSNLGLDEALVRGEAYLTAGADVLFIESPETIEELGQIKQAFPDTWLVANMVEGGRTPYLKPQQLEDMGFAIGIYPLLGLSAAAHALAGAYSHLQSGKTPMPPVASFDELNKTLGFDAIWELDEKLSSS